MEDFTIFIVLGLYWLFSVIKRSSKKQQPGSGRPRPKSIVGSIAERMQEAQRAAEGKLADQFELDLEQLGGSLKAERDKLVFEKRRSNITAAGYSVLVILEACHELAKHDLPGSRGIATSTLAMLHMSRKRLVREVKEGEEQ